LHGLEERRLRLGRRAVDLVGQEQLREDRPREKLEDVLLLVEDVAARDVRRHEVGRELDALEGAAQDLAERAHKQRLAEPRHALDQHVPAREDRDERVIDDLVLSHQRPRYLAADALEPHAEFLHVHREPPVS
jgi:hypothetical protein